MFSRALRKRTLGVVIFIVLGYFLVALQSSFFLFVESPIPTIHTLQRKFTWESQISEDKLLQNPTIKDGRIPRILHQSWKDSNVPEKFRIWQQSWKDTHADWTFILWTDADNRLLVEKYYPELLALYDSFYLDIERVDFSRLLYMHRFGGAYADLDTFALKNSEPLLNNDLVFGSLSTDPNFSHNIPNAWMASVQGDDFWLKAIEQVKSRNIWNWGAEYITGPVMLTSLIKSLNLERVTTWGPGFVFGVDWRNPPEVCVQTREDPSLMEACIKENADTLFILTVWTHSWSFFH